MAGNMGGVKQVDGVKDRRCVADGNAGKTVKNAATDQLMTYYAPTTTRSNPALQNLMPPEEKDA